MSTLKSVKYHYNKKTYNMHTLKTTPTLNNTTQKYVTLLCSDFATFAQEDTSKPFQFGNGCLVFTTFVKVYNLCQSFDWSQHSHGVHYFHKALLQIFSVYVKVKL
jgi:hypothetical protein